MKKIKKKHHHALAFFSFVAHHVKFCKHVYELLLGAAITQCHRGLLQFGVKMLTFNLHVLAFVNKFHVRKLQDTLNWLHLRYVKMTTIITLIYKPRDDKTSVISRVKIYFNLYLLSLTSHHQIPEYFPDFGHPSSNTLNFLLNNDP